jgi:hypothetical protein
LVERNLIRHDQNYFRYICNWEKYDLQVKGIKAKHDLSFYSQIDQTVRGRRQPTSCNFQLFRFLNRRPRRDLPLQKKIGLAYTQAEGGSPTHSLAFFLFSVMKLWAEGCHTQWRTATGNAATVATATYFIVKDNKAEKIR